jgi:hypothetical protein
MPPLTIEVGIALALATAMVRVTTSITRIEQQQKIGHAELIGEIRVLKEKISFLEKDSSELKAEIKESRKYRYLDKASD